MDDDIFCPFSADGDCPADCRSVQDRQCVNGEDDDEEDWGFGE